MTSKSFVALKDLPQKVETLVVGAGLSGLAAAALLARQGKEVLLVEALGQTGGRFSPEARDGFQMGAGFAFGQAAPWREFSARLGLDLSLNEVAKGGALQFGAKGWSAPADLPEWENLFSETVEAFPEGGLPALTERLFSFCADSERFRCVTGAPVTELKVAAGTAVSVTLGQGKVVEADEIVWAAPYRALLETLSGEVPEPGAPRVSWLKKFVKSQPQPAVVMEFAHKQNVSDLTETLFLPFPVVEKEERHFLAGSFASNRADGLAPQGKQLSSWIFPLTDAEWGDNHESMKKIRAAHRLLEKAFPGFEGTKLFDRVLVLGHSFAPAAKKKSEATPLLPNLRLASDWAAPEGATGSGLIRHLLAQF